MKVAVIADVHSNIQALEAVLDHIRSEKADLVVCAGDIVGYGANPNECCAMAREVCGFSVAGNHDVASLTGDSSGMNPYAAAAIFWTHHTLTDGSKELLSSLKRSGRLNLGGVSVALYHGSPGDMNEYVYEDDVDEKLLEDSGAAVTILGHTHIPYVRQLPSGLVLNPGSVGQPRDGDPRASLGLLRLPSRECDIVRVEYPVARASEAIKAAGLPSMLAQRLSIGR